MAAKRDPRPDSVVRLRGWVQLAVGLAMVAIGAIVFAISRGAGQRTGVVYFGTYVPLLAGGVLAAIGALALVQAPSAANRRDARWGLGYKSFVAWRYLLVADRKVTPRTTRLLAIEVGLHILLGLLRGADVGVGAEGEVSPIAVLQLGALVLLIGTVFVGVLRFSKPALITGLVGVGVLALAWLGFWITGLPRPPIHLEPEAMASLHQGMNLTRFIGAGIAGLAIFFGCLRGYFTFFTTVPIGGVWIGTAALVIVLSVMGGFESDLREKILGSNAHLQITREEGDFTDWREVQAKIDQIPGVVASTPYAVSEVVVAANNQGANVVIKGIDPRTVGKVTDLVSDLEDREAIKRLDPLVPDPHDLRVPQPPRAPGTGTGKGPVIDPPPPDMPASGDPIDFSAPDDEADRATARAAAGSGDGPGSVRDELVERPQPFGGDAESLLSEAAPGAGESAQPGSPASDASVPARGDAAVVDPPPPDLVRSDEPPIDYSHPDDLEDAVVKVIDVPFDTPSLSRRTQSLPGILVGRELVKQTHLYTGEEVRVVSPLSDPANPDANGTPIPFNRDYRVAGVFFTGMYEYDLKYVYVTLESLQDFLDRGDTIDGIEIRVDNPYDTDAFVAKFQAIFGPQYRVQDWKELNRSLFSALKLEKIAMFLVLGIVILVASFSIVGNLVMVVVEKAREIALLKTLGASDLGVMQLFAIQGLMIGVIGTVLGITTGLLGCWALSRFGFPLNADVYYIDRLPVHVDPASVLAAGTAGILISIGATIYPAVIAARVRPAAGMRH